MRENEMELSWMVLFTLIFPRISLSAEKLYLNPSAECGVFTTTKGEWATAAPSDVKLCYDSNCLYLDVLCKAGPGASFIIAGKKDDDLSIFDGDVFEFQIAPPKQNGVYYHLAFSPSGYLYSAKRHDTHWNPEGLVRSSKVTGNEWRFHIAVPSVPSGRMLPPRAMSGK